MIHHIIRIRRILGPAVLIFSSLILSLLLAELVVRLVFPQYSPAGQVKDFAATATLPPLGQPNSKFRQTENTGEFEAAISFNRYGFRDSRDFSKSTAEDLFVVGDSFCFGWGVDERDRFSSRLETAIGPRIFNICIPKANLDDYLKAIRYAQSKGATVRNVILTVTMENDLLDYSRTELNERSYRYAPKRSGLKIFLVRHSALYFLATTAAHLNATAEGLLVKTGLMSGETVNRIEFSGKAIESSADRVALIAEEFRTTVLIVPSRGLWVGNNRAIEDQFHRAFVKKTGRDEIRFHRPSGTVRGRRKSDAVPL